MLELEKLSKGDIIVDDYLKWDLFNADGLLLLAMGEKITSQSKIDNFFTNGVFRKNITPSIEKPKEKVPDKSMLLQINSKVMESIYKRILKKDKTVLSKLEEIYHDVSRIAEADPDFCLAYMHLQKKELNPYEHALYYGMLSIIVSKEFNYEESRKKSLFLAAITANVTLSKFTEKLNNHNGKLPPKLRGVIDKHPEESVGLLREIGVNDDLWLDIILKHHEKIDGTGYPSKIKGCDVIEEARILSLCEYYVSLVSKRAYRSNKSGGEAVKDLISLLLLTPETK